MVTRLARALTVLTCLTALAQSASAQDASSPWSLVGLAFGDLYHLPSHHTEEGDGATGAVLRRGYLTLNYRPDTPWFGRARLELNQSGEFETYDFEVDFKDLYIGYKFDNHQLTVGLQPTLTFDEIESLWGLRHLMRTPADLQGFPSRDTGISLKGRINDAWSYRLMNGIGEDFGAETGNSRKWMAAAKWQLNQSWFMDFYSDYEELPGQSNRLTGQVFGGYEVDDLRFGIQYYYQDRQAEIRAEFASVFAVKSVNNKLDFIGRVDRILEPNPEGANISYIPFDPTARATLFLAAIQYSWTDRFAIIPNTIVIDYDRNDDGIIPETDFYIRLSFFPQLRVARPEKKIR